MNNQFLENNIKLKVQDLQEEHIVVLREIFKSYNENAENPYVSQCFVYSDISQKLRDSVEEEILKICLHDLEIKGFVTRINQSHNAQWAYAITYLVRKTICFLN